MIVTQFVEARPGLQLAYRHRPGRGATILFLPGYASDMSGTKATALAEWAARVGRGSLLFDYAGCGESGGEFEAQSLRDWLGDALYMIDHVVPEGPILLVGSSMGGWLALHLAIARPLRIVGLVGVAAAPDFTDWGFTPEQKMAIARDGRLEEPNPYGPVPTVTTRAFFESAEAHRLLHVEIPIDCPVRLVHGMRDTDVPPQYAAELMGKLRSADVQTILVKSGDHRLSRHQDIDLLLETVANLVE
ncbi:alpha/beta hydrolase [Allosphingosinicella sp.]|uniref:alpha/beta hydrolase n=1 Tax=Allosphingosinicella sp. TaxID=2823234 RepID=UPI0037837D4C